MPAEKREKGKKQIIFSILCSEVFFMNRIESFILKFIVCMFLFIPGEVLAESPQFPAIDRTGRNTVLNRMNADANGTASFMSMPGLHTNGKR